jgi:hypothetical protein
MVSRAIVQTVLIDKLKKENELRLGGHNMGPAPLLLGAVMKAIIAAIKDYAEKCNHEPDWWTKEGGGAPIKRNVFDIFDQHNTDRLVNDRSAQRFLEASPLSQGLRQASPLTA